MDRDFGDLEADSDRKNAVRLRDGCDHDHS